MEEKGNIIVTGVSKGVGLSIARQLLESGYGVYGISRSSSLDLELLLSTYNAKMHWLSFDLGDPERIKDDIFKHWIGFNTPIHGLVNNAALAYDDLVTNLSEDLLESMFRVNVFTPMQLTKYSIRQMLLSGIKGSIVHISSISVHTGYKGLAMYAASKGALEAFSKNTAREWGEKGIRSNCIVAGFMETNMSASLDQTQKNRIYQRTSLKQPTDIVSVGSTVEFLLSEGAKSITGQNIFVDSGTI